MRSINILSIICMATFILACGNNSTTDAAEASKIQPTTVGSTNPDNSAQTVSTDKSVPTTGNVTTPVNGSSAGLNPAHGEPGHRCDIPVGSPLNSKPAQQPEVKNTQSVKPEVISQPTQTITQPAGSTTQTSGLNPQHGEPGHRCDIPVGSPLNSKPAQQPEVKNTQSVQPEVISQPAGSTTKTSGLNPQHGQPGHRCDIAVGAPLNSQPTQTTTTKNTTLTVPSVSNITPTKPVIDSKKQ